jgi:amino acid transporter
VLLIVAGLSSVSTKNLVWTGAPATGDVARASTVLIFAFLGIESALVPSGEVRNPSRTVPRAIFIAMAAVTVLYLAIQVVAQGILGAALAGQKTPLAEAAAVALGPMGRVIILVGSIVSMFGYMSGMTLAAPRMLYAFGRDGFLPKSVGAVHRRFRTPYVAIAIQTALVIVLATSGTFEKLVIVANGAVLLVYAACCVSVLELRRRKVQESGTPFRVPFGPAIAALAVLVVVWLLTSLTASEWKGLLAVLAAAIVVYVISRPSRHAAASIAESA